MLFLGVDFGRRNFEALLTDEVGQPKGKSKRYKNHPKNLQNVISTLEKEGYNIEDVIFGLETAGNFWINFAKFLDKHELEWYPIHPNRIYHLRKAETGGARTDPIDAWLIGKATREDYFNPAKSPGTLTHKSVHQQDGLKELTRLREMVTEHNTAYKRSLNASVHLTFPGYWEIWGNNYTKTGFRILEQFPSWNVVLTLTKEEFIQALSDMNKTAEKHAMEIYTLAEQLDETPLPSQGEVWKIQYLIPLILKTDEESNEIEKDIDLILEQKHQAGVPNLQELKGVGLVTESKILAETGDIHRFNRYKNYTSYCGTIPLPDDSGDTKKDRKAKRNCNGNLRATMISGAVHLIQHNPLFRALYISKLGGSQTKEAKRRARLYIANKLARVVYHLLKTGERFDAMKMLPSC